MAHSNEYVEELKILHNKKTFGVTKGIPLVVNKLIEEKKLGWHDDQIFRFH